MSIGETLAQARRWSGLTVGEVSQRTRIRETLVKDIESDDYSACGGDFYTRGHIRAIARVVGTDPEPLIEEYDAARRPTADTMPDLGQQLSSGGVRGWQQRREPPAGPPGDGTRRIPPVGSPDREQDPPSAGPPRTGVDRAGLLRTDSAQTAAPRGDRPHTEPPAAQAPRTEPPSAEPHRTETLRIDSSRSLPPRADWPRPKPRRGEVPHPGGPPADAPRTSVSPRDPHQTETLRIDSSRTAPPRSDPPRTSPPRTEPPRSDLARTEPRRSGLPQPDAPRTDVSHEDPPRPGLLRIGDSGSDPRRTGPPGSDAPSDGLPRTAGLWSSGPGRTGRPPGASYKTSSSPGSRGRPELLQRLSAALERGPGQGNWPVLFGLALVVTLGFLGYYFVYGSSSPPAPATGNSPATGTGQTSRAGGAAHLVVVHLTAVQASSVEFSTPAGKTLFRATVAAGSSKRWTFRGPVTMRLVNPGAVRLLVDGKNPLPRGPAARPVTLALSPGRPPRVASTQGTPTPASTPSQPVLASVPLAPAAATAFGTSGPGQGDNQPLAHLAIDRSKGTSWNTDWYASANFGNLYSGTGLLLDMGKTVTITSAQIDLGGAPGADFQLRVGNNPTMPGLGVAARSSNSSGTVNLRLSAPAQGRYVLIWFTKLPLNASGNFEASVYNAALEGRS